MLAFTKLRSALKYDELKEFFSILTIEKGLRCYDFEMLLDFLEGGDEDRWRELYPGIGSGKGVGKGRNIRMPVDDPSEDTIDEK